jgi:hypothetical protein
MNLQFVVLGVVTPCSGGSSMVFRNVGMLPYQFAQKMKAARSSEGLVSYIISPRRWRQHSPPKRWYPTISYGVTRHKTTTWISLNWLRLKWNLNLSDSLVVLCVTTVRNFIVIQAEITFHRVSLKSTVSSLNFHIKWLHILNLPCKVGVYSDGQNVSYFRGTERFNIMFTTACLWISTWSSRIQFTDLLTAFKLHINIILQYNSRFPGYSLTWKFSNKIFWRFHISVCILHVLFNSSFLI